MKYTKTKFSPCLLLAMLLALSCYDVARATTTISRISSGHVNIFEAEYENDGTNAPTIHLGVHAEQSVNGVVVDKHYEPGDVLLEIGSAAYGSTAAFSPTIISLLGANAWILPADLDIALSLGLIEAGVAKAGFPAGSVTFTMIGAGAANPGNFALFSSSSAIRLSATKSGVGTSVGTSSFSISTDHIHYSWGFSAPGTYTFDMQASYDTDPDPLVVSLLQSSVETYTFNVIPEPTCGTLLLIGLVGWVAARKRVVLKE